MPIYVGNNSATIYVGSQLGQFSVGDGTSIIPDNNIYVYDGLEQVFDGSEAVYDGVSP